MKPKYKITLSLFILGLATLACGWLNSNPTQSPPEQPTSAILPTEETKDDTSILPHTLYFLSDIGTGGFQVWRLERDSITQNQVTTEAVPVTDFAVSPVDGRVAYVVNNQLYIINPDGGERTLLVDGGTVDEENPDYHFSRKINGLSWSPDGNYLAFGRNGINIYTFAEDASRLALPSNLETKEGVYPYPQALYVPLSWSPDGRFLLMDIGFYEGAALGVFDLTSGGMTRFGERIVCCQPAWTPDSNSVLVANPYAGFLDSGLWRYDAATGFVTELVSEDSSDGTLNFVGWPMQIPSGELQYFFTNIAGFPESGIGLTVVRAGNDGVSGRTLLRQETWDLYEVLWAPDGSLFVAIQPYYEDTSMPRDGTIILVDVLGEPVRPLVVNGYKLRWGP